RNHTFAIDVVTAPQSLLTKVAMRAHLPPPSRGPQLAPPQLHARLQELAPELAKAAGIRFGDVRVVPRLEVLPIDERAQPTAVTIRFTGEIPKKAGPFVWQ